MIIPINMKHDSNIDNTIHPTKFLATGILPCGQRWKRTESTEIVEVWKLQTNGEPKWIELI